MTKIKLYQKQKELLDFINKNGRVLTLSSRQTGKCVFKDSTIKLRNKKSGEIQEMKIADFFDLVSKQQHSGMTVK